MQWKRGIIVCICILGIASSVFSQGPYQLSWKTDGILLGASTLLVAGDILSYKSLREVTSTELGNLNSNEINKFDIWAFQHSSKSADFRSDIGLLLPAAISSFSTLGIPFINRDKSSVFDQFFTLGDLWVETNVLNFTATELVKNSVKRIRPEAYAEGFNPEGLSENDNLSLRKSFFSRHVSLSSSSSFFLLKVL